MAVGNWSRWGNDDERGALNLVDEKARRRGLAAVVTAQPVSLGLPVKAGSAPKAAFRADVQHVMLRDGGDYAAGLSERPGYGFADDQIQIACHGTTHLDALSHVWQGGVMWNGFPSTDVTSRGAKRAGIETVGPVVTRGILIDMGPGNGRTTLFDGQAVEAEDIQRELDRLGVVPEPGDALLIRTGWLARWREGTASETRWPGLGASCASLIASYDVALIGADNIAVEVGPSEDPACAMPLHIALIRDHGVFFMELLDLEELSTLGATTFLLVVTPLNIVGGSGSPVAPLALV